MTSAQAKVGGEDGAELPLLGWASQATFWNSDLRADTRYYLGHTATIHDTICESFKWGQKAYVSRRT